MKYKIVRFYTSGCGCREKVVKYGLSLDEAKKHCQNPSSYGRTKDGYFWFDGFTTSKRRAADVGETMKIRAKHYLVTKYWLEYYATNHCTLCGNSGIIDTTGIKTPAGLPVGRKNYCICPNGQTYRKVGVPL